MARQRERLSGAPQKPAGAIHRLVRSRLAVKTTSPTPTRIVQPDFSREIAASRQEMVLLASQLEQRRLDLGSYEAERKQQLEKIIDQSRRELEVVNLRKEEARGATQRRLAAEKELDLIVKSIASKTSEAQGIAKDHEILLKQIKGSKDEIGKLSTKREQLIEQRFDLKLTTIEYEQKLKDLDGELKKKELEIAGLVGAWDDFRKRMNDLRVYERRIARYYQEAGLTLKI